MCLAGVRAATLPQIICKHHGDGDQQYEYGDDGHHHPWLQAQCFVKPVFDPVQKLRVRGVALMGQDRPDQPDGLGH